MNLNGIGGPGPYWPPWFRHWEEGLVNELKFLLTSYSLSVFQGRECNRVARELASLGYVSVGGNDLFLCTVL